MPSTCGSMVTSMLVMAFRSTSPLSRVFPIMNSIGFSREKYYLRPVKGYIFFYALAGVECTLRPPTKG
eukprot:5804055-Prymnesium_polylepis.1